MSTHLNGLTERMISLVLLRRLVSGRFFIIESRRSFRSTRVQLFRSLRAKIGVPVKKLTDYFFRESEPGYVKHTAASKALLQISLLALWSLMGMSEVTPAKMHVSLQTTMCIP